MTKDEMEQALKSLEKTLEGAIKERQNTASPMNQNTDWIHQWDKTGNSPNPLIDKWTTPWVPPAPFVPGAPTIPVPMVDTDTWPPEEVPGIEVGILFIGKDKKLYIRTADGDIALDSVADIKKLVTKLLLQDKLDT